MNVGFSELILVLLVAFVIVGPKDLPKVARAIARWVKYFQQLFQEFKDETGLEETITELKKSEDELKETMRQVDPSVELRKAQLDIQKSVREAKTSVKGNTK